ncbi:class I SAM-dependent methyltransferase [Streptomyces cupreus]|uniref:Methyltransferase domain-containing protein n=1 Tax=Streptomyces cupreus TaxID=2759956 RepID=A0A7X1M6M3_9ACTN|nr:class I SAM-dependent methyltransferase [Streptomyces cupreus]MBC2900234.1 methyltransferase domain-containing protein [Streptomyces cupreus]
MDAKHLADDDQAARWRAAGHAWVETQELLDGMLRPLEELLVERVPAGRGGHVLDVGCGTGSTTLAVARRLGPTGHAVGIDISEPMITAARERVARAGEAASFILADAEHHAFEPAAFDAVISRLGVMFFTDSVRAFANLRRAAKDEAWLRFIAWRGAEENPFMTTAERAAAPLVPNLPARRPEGPGQFAFADPDRIRDILTKSGWSEIDIRPVELSCTLPESELVGYFTRLGPLGLILPDVDEDTRPRVIETVRAAFDPYVQGTEVRFTAACWTVDARAS